MSVRDETRHMTALEALERLTGVHSQVILPEAADAPGDGSAAQAAVISPTTPELKGRARRTEQYQILGEIARGGVGIILKGHDVDLGRDLAMKVLREDHVQSPAMIQRFVEEAQIAGQLQHPGIVPVYELGLREDGRPYFSMKLVKGRTLADLFEERDQVAGGTDTVDPAQARRRFLAVFEQVCQTVAYAHSRGVVHRDLKPSNVMVGSFGEVLVVDWGFAKVLARGGVADEERALRRRKSASEEIHTVRTGKGSVGSESIAGSVFGTPAYMAPEQARGEVDQVDERSDVFSLGSILCEVLTGDPCYAGPADAQLKAAAHADLADALERLGACGADGELIAIARRCLAPRAADRPRNAGVVAALLARYFATVQERARRAQIEAAEARGKALEERRARRLTVWLAAAIVASTVAGGAFAWLHYRQLAEERRRVEREIDDALRDAARFETDGQWQEANDAMHRAVALNGAAGIDQGFRAEVEQSATELETRVNRARFLEHLDALRNVETLDELAGLSSPGSEPGVDAEDMFAVRDGAYAAAFAEHGIDIAALPIGAAAERIRHSGMAVELCRALDAWALARGYRFGDDSPEARQLVTIAIAADDDPLRVKMRNAYLHRDAGALKAMVADVENAIEPPVTLSALAYYLFRLGARAEAGRVLFMARDQHPADLGVHTMLGWFFSQQEQWTEAVESLRVARALRPDSVNTLMNTARCYRILGRFPDAIAILEDAQRLRPEHANVASSLGMTYRDAGDTTRAIECYEKALRLRPDSSRHAAGWLGAIADRDGTDAALAALDRARAEHDDDVPLLLGGVDMLRKKNESQRALALAREAVALEPVRAVTHRRLGWLLFEMGRFDEAVAACRESVRLDADDTGARSSLAWVLTESGRFDEAIECIEEWQRIAPGETHALRMLALAYEGTGDLKRAEKTLRESIEIDPEVLENRNRLAYVLLQAGQVDEAFAVHDDVLAQSPRDPYALEALAWSLLVCPDPERRDAARARILAEQALELDPRDWISQGTLALALLRQGDAQGALDWLDKIPLRYRTESRFAPVNALVLASLGRIDEARTRLAEAHTWIARARPRDPLVRELAEQAQAAVDATAPDGS